MNYTPLSSGFPKAAALVAFGLALSIQQSSVASVTVAPGAGVQDTGTLSITAGEFLDMNNNPLIVRTTAYSTVRGYVATGFNAGTWDGFGIRSTTAAGLYPTALGIIDNSIAQFPTFAGKSVSANTESLVKYTYYGDADLSGNVNTDDFNLFLDGFNGNAAPDWLFGDFDYSGGVNTDDFNIFLDGFNYNGPQLFTSGGGGSGGGKAVVPEPSVLALALFGAVGALARRHRKANN